MRDQGFVANHRGGRLSKENHQKLMEWAWACAMHVLPLLNKNTDARLIRALEVAKDWATGQGSVGDAMKASVAAHAAAREYTDTVCIAVARSIGHAVATAHMADHALGAALYALKAVNQAGLSMEEERLWQNRQLEGLPLEIVQLVQLNMQKKEISFKM